VNNIVDFKQFERLRDLIPTGKTVVWCREWKTSKNKFLARDEMQHPGRATTQEYMNSDGNVVFYNWQIRKWDSPNGSTPVVKEHPEILDQVAAEAKRLVNLPVDSK